MKRKEERKCVRRGKDEKGNEMEGPGTNEDRPH